MRLTSLLLCWTAVVASVVAAPALGSERPLVPPSRSASEGATERKVTGWFEQLDAAHEEVLAQEWKKATRRLETVELEAGHVFIEGAGAQHLFGQLSLLWALVHAGRGDQEVAAWDYAMACSLLEPLESLDLARYGAAGATLTRARESWATLAPIECKGEPPAGATLPRTLDRSPMALPPSLRGLCLDELVSMSVTIDTTGRPVRARVVPEIDSMLAFAALRSLRSWRFSPAQVDGRPVASVYPVHLQTRTRGGSCVER